jgi:hypothetical protein
VKEKARVVTFGRHPGQETSMEQMIKMRVLNRYRGSESDQFPGGDGGVPEGAVIVVTQERARQLIANGNAAPIVGGGEKKPAGPQENSLGNGPGATVGVAAPSASSQAAPASPAKTAKKPAAAKKATAGKSSR